ncbi:unnamed protein product [Zymoseptoria tritici ST99CH_3D7]|uniref:Zn(2)-C6 fungal-type domain-containing protein n=2 Tax=Zymoseptoria tritici TaxID=1047171 RepID=A0A1X7RQD4_ZYMT9|nr:unnamed protein product [Zymoseptoria tritici ST99CH_3D7]SMR50616.1 unnamed protein product [Zymoseptoria tritici ST99CH_1E4]
MMMTQSYYTGDFDTFSRSNQRANSSAAYYDRTAPYSHGYYDTQNDLRSEYVGRPGNRTLIADNHDQDQHSHGHQRRRIQVACSRCRKRKIRCSGDAGDGSGCSNCHSAGVDKASCTFHRVGTLVGSHALTTDLDGLPVVGSNSVTSPVDIATTAYDVGIYQPHHRQSLPMLQTRMAYSDYDYGSSSVDDYTYSASMPRQSVSINHGLESFRPYTSGPLSAPATSSSMYYESGTPFSYGNLQGAPYTMPTSRLPSAAGEAFSPLNMASMHSSLPSQTVQERRLPFPHQPAYPQRVPTPEVPQIRPLGSFNESRAHITGIHSRTGMPWSTGTSRNDSINGVNQSVPTSSDISSTYPSNNDPAFGYQFRASTKSPAISPTTTSSLSDSFQSTNVDYKSTPLMMLPPTSTKRTSRASTTRPVLPSIGGNEDYRRPSSSSREAAASLYSFSTGVDVDTTTSADRHQIRQANGSDDYKMVPNDQQQRYTSPRHSQPTHSASVDELRRRSSFDQQQQQQRAATAHQYSLKKIEYETVLASRIYNSIDPTEINNSSPCERTMNRTI